MSLEFLTLEGRVVPQVSTCNDRRLHDADMASRTGHWPHEASLASDGFQGSVGSGAFVLQQESQKMPIEVWVTHSALGLTLALHKSPGCSGERSY